MLEEPWQLEALLPNASCPNYLPVPPSSTGVLRVLRGKMQNSDSPASKRHRLENILPQGELKGAQYLRCPHTAC